MQGIALNESFSLSQYHNAITNNQTAELLLALLFNPVALWDLLAACFAVIFIWLWNCRLDRKIRINLPRLEIYIAAISSAYIFQINALQEPGFPINLYFCVAAYCAFRELQIMFRRPELDYRENIKSHKRDGMSFSKTTI